MDSITHGTGHDRLAEIRTRMRPIGELPDGGTPWDTLTHEDLVFLVQSYHAVASDAYAVMRREGIGDGGRERRDAVAQLQASLSHVHSDHFGPSYEHVAFGLSDGGEPTEREALEKHMESPVSGLLAFDVPTTVWWACPKAPIMVGGTRERARTCACTMGPVEASEGCAPRRVTWDDWRARRATP